VLCPPLLLLLLLLPPPPLLHAAASSPTNPNPATIRKRNPNARDMIIRYP